jgi:hypothetical protein
MRDPLAVLNDLCEICRPAAAQNNELSVITEKISSLTNELGLLGVSDSAWLDFAVKQSVFFNYSQETKKNGRDNLASEQTKVYLIKSIESGLYKIGASSRLEKRVREIQNGNAGDIELIVFGKGGTKRELELHQRFSAKRLNGEWFKLDQADVDELVSELDDYAPKD